MPSRPDALRRWLPVLGWAALIFVLSTGWFSGEHTGAVIAGLLGALFPGAHPATLEAAHQGLRKAAHFGEYFVLSLLIYRALRDAPGWSARHALLALALAALYAVSDELHQSFESTRVGSAADCLVDVAGALAAQALVAARERPLRRASLLVR